MIEKILFALAAGFAAAKLTEQQQQAVFKPVLDAFSGFQGFNFDSLINDKDVEKQVFNDFNLPRGIRNNNPTNIRFDGTQWQGLDSPQSDGAFCRFVDVKYGIRAAAKILQSYANRDINTINRIINTWAPPSENNTQSYIDSVAHDLGWDKNALLPSTKWPELIKAIIKHENGQQPYALADIVEGVALA